VGRTPWESEIFENPTLAEQRFGEEQDSGRAAMRRQGVDISIRKPYGSNEILQVVRKILSDA